MTNLHQVIRHGLVAILLVGSFALADDPRELTWDDLLPDTEPVEQPINKGSRSDEDMIDDEGWEDGEWESAFMTPLYPTGVVEELNGELVKIPGFVVPLEFEGEGMVKEFLLVPYFGACIHYPPPPPNQLVYIVAEEPIDVEDTWEPIWASGNLTTEFRESGLGSAGYSMVARNIEKYEY